MGEGPLRGLTLWIDGKANGAKLHLGNWMMAITALWSRRKSDDVASLRFGEYSLERCGWQVVALVDDDLSVVRHEILERDRSTAAGRPTRRQVSTNALTSSSNVTRLHANRRIFITSHGDRTVPDYSTRRLLRNQSSAMVRSRGRK